MPGNVQKITPFLWFDSQAEEAAQYYVSIFPNSRVTQSTRYDEAASKAAGRPLGSVMTVAFELEGQEFVAINGGPHFKFTEAISLVVNCDTQQELDEVWSKLTAGGEEVECGWLKDKFGLSWQVVPSQLNKWLSDKDPKRSNRVMAEVLKMKKLDIERMERAYRL
jgi:predicted 3-demethylubiquinone-9 3-methyltransferase (glyoxalase superfamily)